MKLSVDVQVSPSGQFRAFRISAPKPLQVEGHLSSYKCFMKIQFTGASWFEMLILLHYVVMFVEMYVLYLPVPMTVFGPWHLLNKSILLTKEVFFSVKYFLFLMPPLPLSLRSCILNLFSFSSLVFLLCLFNLSAIYSLDGSSIAVTFYCSDNK